MVARKIGGVFGDAVILLEAYKDSFTDKPSDEEFLGILLTLLPEVIQENYYDQHPASMLGWEAVMYFTEDPAKVRKRLSELMLKLSEGFKTLEQLSAS